MVLPATVTLPISGTLIWPFLSTSNTSAKSSSFGIFKNSLLPTSIMVALPSVEDASSAEEGKEMLEAMIKSKKGIRLFRLIFIITALLSQLIRPRCKWF